MGVSYLKTSAIMKRFALLTVALCAVIYAGAFTLSPETLRYKVSYKWGLVHKNAGTATLRLNVSGSNARAILYARTDPWADGIYNLRDTLISNFPVSTCLPTTYTRIAHEDGSYARDEVKFSRSGNNVSATTTRWRKGKKDSQVTKTTGSLSAQGITVDMMSAFYYLRTLDFPNLTKGSTKTINIFSGKKKELLKITYIGTDNVKINGKDRPAYKVKFTFTSDGRKESSDPIEAWIAQDERRTPLLIVGSLKIGKIRCTLAE